jgi:hypothetical protein
LQEGVSEVAFQPEAAVTWFINDRLSLDANATLLWSPDWLIWQQSKVLGRFRRQQARINLLGYWFPSSRQELRLQGQWITVSANARQALGILPGGSLAPLNTTPSDFSLTRFGLQLRYRYDIAPTSSVYLVYSRGGSDTLTDAGRSMFSLLGSATDVRDAEQLYAKVSYRF